MSIKKNSMEYKKPFISIENQIIELKNKGLVIEDDIAAYNFLSNVSYYRLRAYTYPYQDNSNPNHPFLKTIKFEEINALYEFDSKIRILIFQAIEKIEIAIRTQIIYQMAKKHGSHWHTNPRIFKSYQKFIQHLNKLYSEIERSDEEFIIHYSKNYKIPEMPPCWMSLEVCSMGFLSKMFVNIVESKEKNEIAKSFGLKKSEHLENWLYCLSILRNHCAHHSRIWNRRFSGHMFLPYNTYNPFLSKVIISSIHRNKLFSSLSVIKYLLDIIDKNNCFKKDIIKLLKSCDLINLKEMGFREDWENYPIWKK